MYINTIIYKENKLKVSYHHRSNISETESTETISTETNSNETNSTDTNSTLLDEKNLEKVPLTRRHISAVWSYFDMYKDITNDVIYCKCKACDRFFKVKTKQNKKIMITYHYNELVLSKYK